MGSIFEIEPRDLVEGSSHGLTLEESRLGWSSSALPSISERVRHSRKDDCFIPVDLTLGCLNMNDDRNGKYSPMVSPGGFTVNIKINSVSSTTSTSSYLERL